VYSLEVLSLHNDRSRKKRHDNRKNLNKDQPPRCRIVAAELNEAKPSRASKMTDRGRRVRRQVSDLTEDISEESDTGSGEDYDPRIADSMRRAGRNE